MTSEVREDRPRKKLPESVLVVIYTRNLQVLVMQRADRLGFWQSVTGSREYTDEPLSETCRREVLEETGIDVYAAGMVLEDWRSSNRYEIYAHWRHRYAEGVTHNLEHVFGLRVPAMVPVRLAPREHVAFRWLPWYEAANLCVSPSNIAAIRALPERVTRQDSPLITG